MSKHLLKTDHPIQSVFYCKLPKEKEKIISNPTNTKVCGHVFN